MSTGHIEPEKPWPRIMTATGIKDHLGMIAAMTRHRPPGFRWHGPHGFLLEKGKTFPLPAYMAARRGNMKQCYATSAKTAMKQRGPGHLVYCEGYAIPDGLFPMEHAWILDISPGQAGHRVIETTWQNPGLEYFGIAFNTAFLRESLKDRNYVGLISNWEQDYPLLRMTDEELSNAFHPTMEIL